MSAQEAFQQEIMFDERLLTSVRRTVKLFRSPKLPDAPDVPQSTELPNEEKLRERAPQWSGSFPPKPVAQPVFQPLQEWEGYVTQVMENSFVARLTDITERREHETEEAEFDFDEIALGDVNLLTNGALFRWVIGYMKSADNSTKRRVSEIAFRRLPVWQKDDLEKAKKLVEELATGIEWT